MQELDFFCERRLRDLDAALHARYTESVFAMDSLLASYKNVFPFFTNHTFEHSAQVIHYCNIIAGETIINALNADELYILLMGAALHDVGMGVSETDFRIFARNIPPLLAETEKNSGQSVEELIRRFHHELSAEFIRKYHDLFEIPSDRHTYSIAQVARGHREYDTLDVEEFPPAYPLENGRTVNLSLITALVKLADGLDITSDRNLFFDYSIQNENWSPHQTLCYKCHNAIKKLTAEEDRLILSFDASDDEVFAEVMRLKGKVDRRFEQYNEVLSLRTNFPPRIREILFRPLASKV